MPQVEIGILRFALQTMNAQYLTVYVCGSFAAKRGEIQSSSAKSSPYNAVADRMFH
jgi:hypothetical protein